MAQEVIVPLAKLSPRMRMKARCVAYLGGRCQRCGYSRSLAGLEFHHRDPSQKSFSISGALRDRMGFERLVVELDKCDLICSNCHREQHG